MNRNFGTSLKEGDFAVHVASDSYQRLLRRMPNAGALLESSLTARFAQNLDRRNRYDVLFSTQNEAEFRRRGIQYIHHPDGNQTPPTNELRWFHKIPGMLWAYRTMCRRLRRETPEGPSRNLSLANSKFIAGRIRQALGSDSIILHPPVLGDFPEVPWGQRGAGFVAVGRIHGCKRWEMAVSILDQVRRRGHEVTLTLIGHRDDPEYERRVKTLAATRPWFRMLHDLSREELALEVARHRYGIHTMEEEPFGIAPAEIQRAGCITFVHNSGGPPEIVGDDPRLVFDTEEDAAGKIERMLTDRELEDSLRRYVAAQRERFTTGRFCASLREIVAGFEGGT